jgi:hypothetical protein
MTREVSVLDRGSLLPALCLVVAGCACPAQLPCAGEESRTPDAGSDRSETSITARRLAIVDAEGRERIVLSAEDSWRPWVEIFDKDGISRIQLGGSATGSYGLFLHTKGNVLAAEVVVTEWGSRIRLRDKAGVHRSQWLTLDDGHAEFMLVDESGQVVLRLAPPEDPNKDD